MHASHGERRGGGRGGRVQVVDAPRFLWRGVLLDCGRHFFPLPFLKKFLDVMALHKLNRFHWHLCEDQARLPPLCAAPPAPQRTLGLDLPNTLIISPVALRRWTTVAAGGGALCGLAVHPAGRLVSRYNQHELFRSCVIPLLTAPCLDDSVRRRSLPAPQRPSKSAF